MTEVDGMQISGGCTPERSGGAMDGQWEWEWGGLSEK
jgi:hypothetical protein